MSHSILEPLQLSAGSHKAGSGKGCAMNVISWENGDKIITDFPECSDKLLASLVQQVNDYLANPDTGLLESPMSMKVLELGHATVGTTSHSLTNKELVNVYRDLGIHMAVAGRKAISSLIGSPKQRMYLAQQIDPFEKLFRANVKEDIFDTINRVSKLFRLYVCLFTDESRMNSGIYPRFHITDPENQSHTLKVAAELIALFKEKTGVKDVVIPVEQTKAAVEKMMVVTE